MLYRKGDILKRSKSGNFQPYDPDNWKQKYLFNARYEAAARKAIGEQRQETLKAKQLERTKYL